MHPPFVFTDHRVVPDPFLRATKTRRSLPERLDLTPLATGWPPVPLMATGNPPFVAPSGVVVLTPAVVRVVPPPRRTWKVVLGRWMIRTGQRMIFSN